VNQRPILWSLAMSAKRCFAGVLILFLVSVAFDCEAAQPRRQEVQREARPERNPPGLRESKQDLSSLEARALDAEKSGNWQQAAVFYRQASAAARQTGQLQMAVADGEKAFQLSEKARNPTLQIMAVLNLVRVYNPIQQGAKALDLLVRASEIVKQIAEPIRRQNFEANVHRELGFLYLKDGKLKEAIDYISRSLELRESLLASLNQPKGRGSKNPATAIRNTEKFVVADLLRLGAAYQAAGNFSDGVAAYEKSLKLIKDRGLKLETEGKIYQELGELYLRQKNFPRALEYLNRVMDDPAISRSEMTFFKAASDAGFALIGSGKPGDAIPYFKRAIDSVEASRASLASEELRAAFFDNKRRTYTGIISAQLRVGNIGESFDYNERARSRAFLDILGSKLELARGALLEEERSLQARVSALQAKLNEDEKDDAEEDDSQEDETRLRQEINAAQKAYADFLARVRKENKEQASLMNVEPLTLKEVQERLDPGVTLVEYFVTNDAVILWVVERDRINSVRVALSRKELQAKVHALREAITELTEKETLDLLSRELFKLLIQPALPHVRGKALLIIPHDVLHYLPFQALLSPQGKYLIEEYSINYLSSASLMQFTQEKRKAKGELTSVLAQGGKVLTLGNPDLNDSKMALQFAEIEAKEIKSLYPQSSIYLRKEATEERAKSLSPQSDIIHFASHAELNEDDPLASAIRLAKSDKEDGRLEVREIFGMDLKASLVVLSACETGLGKLSSGDELVGLTRAFIYAGTPSVVASLWNVEDSSTAQLMASFYKNLKTMTKVDALRQAQLNLIRGNVNSDLLARRGIGGVGKLGEVPAAKAPSQDSVSNQISVSTSHPFFWAPFILVGEGK
jgi:CHAT domain-containing protein